MATTGEVSWRTNSFMAFVFGVVFISVVLFISQTNPDPTSSTYATLRTVMALAAAGIGGVLPGFLEVKYKQLLRAGGALALFVVVYFVSPAPPRIIDDLPPTPTADYKPLVSRVLSQIDGGLYGDAFEEVAARFKAQLDRSLTISAMETRRSPLGKVIERKVSGSTALEKSPQGIPGPFRAVTYQTKFENGSYSEHIWVVAEGDSWKFFSYSLGPVVP